MKHLRKFESFDNKMSTEEMIQKLCNFGWERQELEMMSDKELAGICSELPSEMSESKSIREHYQQENYMFFSNIENILSMCQSILDMNEKGVDAILSEHNWALDHIATSADDIEEVYQFLKTHKPSSEISEAKKQWIAGAIKRRGDLRKKMHKGEGEKISKTEIDDEIAKLKKKDKDPDKEGLQLSKTDRTKHKQLVLAKTLKKFK